MQGYQLKYLLSSKGISTTNLKVTAMKRAVKTAYCPNDEVKGANAKLTETLLKSKFTVGDDHHQFYRDTFNVQDLADKLWYELEVKGDSYKYWTYRFFYSLMRQSLINSWVSYNYDKDKEMDMSTFRREVALSYFEGVKLKKVVSRNVNSGLKKRVPPKKTLDSETEDEEDEEDAEDKTEDDVEDEDLMVVD